MHVCSGERLSAGAADRRRECLYKELQSTTVILLRAARSALITHVKNCFAFPRAFSKLPTAPVSRPGDLYYELHTFR